MIATDVIPGTLSASILAAAQAEMAPTLAIVADGQLSVAALEALLLGNTTYRVAERARGVDQIRGVLAAFAPMVVIVDSRWPASRMGIDPGVWSGRTLLLLDPEADSVEFVQAVRARANGYLSRTASREGFTVAIQGVRETGYHLDPVLAERILRAMRESVAAMSTARPGLSRRERDVLVGIANGRSSKEIAREYAITPKTVANHVHNIYRKLNLRHRGELVLYATQEGLAGFAEASLA